MSDRERVGTDVGQTKSVCGTDVFQTDSVLEQMCVRQRACWDRCVPDKERVGTDVFQTDSVLELMCVR